MNIAHLNNIQNVLDEAVETKKNAGLNCLIFKDGREIGYWQAGLADIENKKPFDRSTICRLYSMTKPVTSVAIMTLLEKGVIELYDEVAEYIPEFKNLTVCKDGKVVPCSRPLIIQDLMNMTSGYGYGGDNNESEKGISRLLYSSEGLDVAASGANNISTMQVAKTLAATPLSFEPGTDYAYGMSADILGAVIEAVTGMRFGDYLKKTVFDPLLMKDTAFFVPEEKQKRLSKVYIRPQNKGEDFKLYEQCHLGIQNNMKLDPAFESGGAGLVSTIDDYMKFTLMLTNGGELDGKRILRESTVSYLSEARLRSNLQQCFDWKMEHLSGYTYCNLMRVCTEPGKARALTEKGEFGWDGWLGPYMSVDLKNNLAIVYMTQMVDAGTTSVTRKVKNVIYSAL